jgi:hypothetical protein
LHLMPLPNRFLKTHRNGHVAAIHVITVHHVVHYHADLASLLKRRARLMGRGRIRRQIFPDIWETGSEPGISLEGVEAGPRLGFDSCPRATELGRARDTPVHGQGSSHTLEAPQDVFEAVGEGRRRNPLGERHRALESHHRELRSTRLLLGILESVSGPLADSYRMEHGLTLEFPR